MGCYLSHWGRMGIMAQACCFAEPGLPVEVLLALV